MKVGIAWFRRDLRLADNPALRMALAQCERVVPVYIHAPDEDGRWAPGEASRWWLHHSLEALAASLRERGSRLLLRHGESLAALRELAQQCGADSVFFNRVYEPAGVARDRQVEDALRRAGIAVQHCNANLLNEPWSILKADGAPYRVFTPYWSACQKAGLDRSLASKPQSLPPVSKQLGGTDVSALELLPRPAWYSGLAEHWQPGEDGAQARYRAFLHEALTDYPEQRDRPDHAGTSELSPHLHFGEIGPRQIWHGLQREAGQRGRTAQAVDSYVRQLGWREFSRQLLYHFPHTDTQPLDERFRHLPWRTGARAALAAWQRGQTGIPIVDAGMRQLWHCGWMHNRVRMLVASLLTKNLLIPWQQGARWFWDTLVDADLANNTMGWQWTAGCGADAAPYFRIFNPVLQGERFDPDGTYVRTWVPELSELPDRYLQQPWQAPEKVRRQAGVHLDTDYPAPLVDLKASRERALAAYREIRGR